MSSRRHRRPRRRHRRRVLLVSLVLVLVAGFAGAVGLAQALPGGPSRPLAVGAQFHATWDGYTREERATVLRELGDAGLTAVRIDVSWARVQPDGPGELDEGGLRLVDEVVDQSRDAGMDVLVMFWLTPEWANDGAGERVGPDDPADYADALSRMAARYDGRVSAWEVWNEPNADDFLVGADPAEYAALLAPAYDAVHEAVESARVVFGGVQHADAAWVADALAAGAAGQYDVMAVHPYPGLADAPPEAPTDGTPYTVRALADVVDVVREAGDDVPFWVTEIGWSTHPTAPDAENFERGVDEATQADYSVRLLDLVREDFPAVEAVFFYAERDRDPGSDEAIDNFGLLRADLTPKPVLGELTGNLDAAGGSGRLSRG